jgi:membrane-bound lytic murein transglycosylase D
MTDHQRKKLMGTSSSVTNSAASSGTSSSRFSKPSDNNFVYHKVKSGESLWTIAQKYPGVSDNSIKQLIGFSRRDVQTLQTGQYIKIKRK